MYKQQNTVIVIISNPSSSEVTLEYLLQSLLMDTLNQQLFTLHHNFEVLLGHFLEHFLQVISELDNVTFDLSNLGVWDALFEVCVHWEVSKSRTFEEVGAMAERSRWLVKVLGRDLGKLWEA